MLVGDAEPSGRLTETVAVRLSDHPSHLMFPGESGRVVYGEGVFVGYRGFDVLDREVSHPFGHGLSYTSFAYADLEAEVQAGGAIDVRCRVTNTGARAGTETVHLYYQDLVCEERVPRLLERLGHRQVTLAPGETAEVSFSVTPEMLAKYGRDWREGRKVWPDADPAANPDRLFLVQNE